MALMPHGFPRPEDVDVDANAKIVGWLRLAGRVTWHTLEIHPCAHWCVEDKFVGMGRRAACCQRVSNALCNSFKLRKPKKKSIVAVSKWISDIRVNTAALAMPSQDLERRKKLVKQSHFGVVKDHA